MAAMLLYILQKIFLLKITRPWIMWH